MVRIRVIKKSQLLGGALAVLIALALVAGAWCAWRMGAFGGRPGGALSVPAAEETLSADAPADGTGQLPSADAGASLNVLAPAAAPDADTTYVVSVDLSALPAPTEPGAASLRAILAAGLSADGRAPLAGKSILIYHTHTHESYEKQAGEDYMEISAYRTGDREHSIVRVGAELKRLLEDMGASVYHDTTDYEQDELSTAYARSLATLEQLRGEGRAFDLWIDMHRDAYAEGGSGTPFCAEIDGRKVARLMVLLGTGEGMTGGDAFDVRPDFERNLVWGQRLTDELESAAPGICRPLMVRSGRYNQHISERCLLIEVGHNRNTLEQALGSMPYLARAIAGTLA